MLKNEIITLQFGNYSNYIGAHWWNLQENSFSYDADTLSEINHDVLFREGLNNAREVTFTPRLLLADLKGSLGSLPTRSDLYEEITLPDLKEETVHWSPNKVQVERAPKCEKNDFLGDVEKEELKMDADTSSIDRLIQRYELDNQVHYWSDYLATRFHPRSFSMINKYDHNSRNSFNSFDQGVELWKSDLFCDEWTDKCRVYAEECDYLQGFQVLFDSIDGFSGLCCSSLTHLTDEYANKSIFTIPAQVSVYSEDENIPNSLKIVNSVLSYGELIELSSGILPIGTAVDAWAESSATRSFPNLGFNDKLSYHTSAILAAYLETISASYRRRKTMYPLSNMLSKLTPCGRKLLAGSMRLPFPVYPDLSILESLETLTDTFWTTVTPNANVTLDTSFAQEICVRGLTSFSLFPSTKQKSTNPAYQFQTVEEMLSNFLNFCSSGSAIKANINSVDMPLKIPASYPHIFNENVTRIGCIFKNALPLKFAVAETPVFAGLHNCSSVSNSLEILAEKARKISLNQMRCFFTSGLEKLEYFEAIEKIVTLKDDYDD